ncbi:MAG: 30S ribosomal protein S21 [Patescibacteria group bacterium]|nr:30S ribosomal protein S21 [Patescibacteria group bacterium]MDE2438365.1 30S ribosomal protein S21 [Patescibacteria group bacterium]
MALALKRKNGESVESFVSRFRKAMQKSGVLLEARSRRYHDRVVTKQKRHRSALYRSGKQEEFARLKKLGLLIKKKTKR